MNATAPDGTYGHTLGKVGSRSHRRSPVFSCARITARITSELDMPPR